MPCKRTKLVEELIEIHWELYCNLGRLRKVINDYETSSDFQIETIRVASLIDQAESDMLHLRQHAYRGGY